MSLFYTVRIPTHFAGTIADYSPKSSPMIPSLLIHCLQEIESRGIAEGGIYRVSAPDKEINILKVYFTLININILKYSFHQHAGEFAQWEN